MMSNQIFCSECGTANDENSGFCGNCGSKVIPPAQVISTQTPLQDQKQPPQGYQQPPQGYQQPPQGYQQPPQGYQQPPQGYQQPQQGFNPAMQQPGYMPAQQGMPMGYQRPRKDPGVAYIGTLFIPGFAQMYTDNVGMGILLFFLTIFLYMFFLIGFFIHVYLFFTSGGKVKEYNRMNGYME